MNVWEATVDDGAWQVRVERIDDRTGRLEIIRVSDANTFHSEEVGLAYGAIFGPDIDDVALWQDIAIRVIDAQYDNFKEDE